MEHIYAELSECVLRHEDDGRLTIVPPEGKRVGTNVSRQVLAAPAMRDACRLLILTDDLQAAIDMARAALCQAGD